MLLDGNGYNGAGTQRHDRFTSLSMKLIYYWAFSTIRTSIGYPTQQSP